MSEIINSYIEDGFEYTEYSDGAIIKKAIPVVVTQITLEDKVNYLYYKSMGVI